jgi:hypothetical protein
MATKRGRGQPTKLTPEVTERLVEALKAGNYIETACTYAGIGVSTYHAWVAKAEETGANKDFTDFLDAVKKARSEAEIRNVALIQQAAQKNWTAAAWWLERSQPARWGRQTKTINEISGPEGAPIQIEDARAEVLDFIRSRAPEEV